VLELLGVPPSYLYPCCIEYISNHRGYFVRQFQVLDLICFILCYEETVCKFFSMPVCFPCIRYFVSHIVLNPALRLVTLQNVCSIYRRIFILFGFPYLVTGTRFQRSYVNTLTVNAAILPRPQNVDNLVISFFSLCSLLAATGDRFPVFYFKILLAVQYMVHNMWKWSIYIPVCFHYLFWENTEIVTALLWREAGLQSTEKGGLFCYDFLSVIFSLVYGCLKVFFQQKRSINLEFENDWEWVQRCFVIQNPALLSRDGAQFCDISTEERDLQAGNQSQDHPTSNLKAGTLGRLAAVFCVHFERLLSAAFLLSKKETTRVVVVIFHCSPAAQSLRCRMLPIKTLQQRNLKLSIFCSTFFPFSLSRSCSGWMRWKAKQGDTVRHCITSQCRSL